MHRLALLVNRESLVNLGTTENLALKAPLVRKESGGFLGRKVSQEGTVSLGWES
jgi:hypothetical protein